MNHSISFSFFDIVIILLFFACIVFIGKYFGRGKIKNSDDYLLAGRNVGLFLFVLINVSTWYGGILGVGEFSYRYGLVSWFTQGFPYYVFAILFAIFLVDKIRASKLISIPDKIEEIFGRKVSLWAAILVFVLVTPAPYLLMVAQIINLVFGLGIFPSLVIGILLSTVYLFGGGFKSNSYVDAFLFFVMFGGFIFTIAILITTYGGIEFLQNNIPASHLSITGDVSPVFIIVWFIIAFWTFADPGFHQRTQAAASNRIAKYGIIISIGFWIFFDFLTNGIGLYAKAILPNLEEPMLSYPLLAEKVLGNGLKGLFYASMFATIISTLNSFLFLSATTISFDFAGKLFDKHDLVKTKRNMSIGIIAASVFSIVISLLVPSVIAIWYSVGSICIPGLLLLIFTAYYPKWKIPNKITLIESASACLSSLFWLVFKEPIVEKIMFLSEIEPMIVGLGLILIFHPIAMYITNLNRSNS